MSELHGTRELFHSAIIPYKLQDLLGRGRQAAGLLENGGGGIFARPPEKGATSGGRHGSGGSIVT